MDRRSMFFFGASVVCAILIWPCPAEFRWVGAVVSIAYFFAGVLFQIETFSRGRSGGGRDSGPQSPTTSAG